MDYLHTFYGPNAGYVLDLYERYRQDPQTVDPATRAVFAQWSPEQEAALLTTDGAWGVHESAGVGTARLPVAHIVAAVTLAHAMRERGHLGAHLDPLGSEPLGDPALLPETYGIGESELAQLPPSVVGGHAAEHAHNALQAIHALRAMYAGTISYEFDQVKSPVERGWLRDAVGLRLYRQEQQTAAKREILKRLTRVEAFERFLHTTFPGQTRFSIEGSDILIPMLDEIIKGGAESGVAEIMIGMAHRGRLNVLAHVLDKPYAAIIGEFLHASPQEGEAMTESFRAGWIGDVKYHLGAEYVLDERAEVSLKVTLAPNPSHLEFINAVVEGMTRAAQEERAHAGQPTSDPARARAVIIHGEAAFSGEGVVAETMNLWNLPGYRAGGTLHIIVNNQLGYTTEPADSRSTHFASDLAKGFEIPIIHVNADDPDTVLTATRLAFAYQDEFHKDILIDLVGYRRRGHNEGDEPGFTQPVLYETIQAHPSVREIYARQLAQEGIVTAQEAESMVREVMDELEHARHEATQDHQLEARGGNQSESGDEQPAPPAVSAQQLQTFNQELLTWPESFEPNARLARLLQRRGAALETAGGIDWGQAEALAFASILAAGTPIRLGGQDSERGTFSHRHAVLHHRSSGEVYIPLQHIRQAQATFAIYNSPLSEVAVLGFEYGYSVHAPETLVLWEAQFGDFANVAQVIIDQFVSSGRTKWLQESALVLLLPHGYEGKGPEHSSARLERFLALSAYHNWRVVNCSTAAQYFHVLRRQACALAQAPRPLVIMTPKSLLRHPLSGATLSELATGHFQPVLDDSAARQHSAAIRRLLFCSGKIAIDLLGSPRRQSAGDVALLRVEELYPFPQDAVRRVLAAYPQAREVVWVQEEPQNMGAWQYVSTRLSALLSPGVELQVLARPESASPASGFADLFQAEQQRLVESALGSTLTEVGGSKHGH
ncbi:MAG TPA: 2-oxoglutarate dehydrogenase E1 component [Ktedonobacteraceae bacterium]|jgi:2-oxoglutarate dehydrogenase E1 component